MRDNIVYDSDAGPNARCPTCGKRLSACVCRAAPVRPPARGAPSGRATPSGGQQPPRDGVVRIFRDRKQRGGKVVTVIHGLPGHPQALADMAVELKRMCGSGGTVKDGAIEIQGDHRDRVAAHLTQSGFRVKLAGG